ncbi:GntR family transcriptional regulator [Nocardioides sp. LHG3406-4]|uniref:GntR family transcriptional regulator n=1 Tax=Nocardioides sp. LHG3406-4 TaxID=2804575 RepID=UPI003CE8F514
MSRSRVSGAISAGDATAGRLDAPPPRRGDQSISDWVHDVVRRDILEGRLRPEEVLVEGVLAERFGVSRGPAREALQRLHRSELVRAIPRLGYIVTSVSVRDYDEIFQTRIALEPLAAELATRRIAEGLVDTTTLIEVSRHDERLLDESIRDGGASLARANHEFHLEVARLSGNRRLERIIDGLHDDLQRVLAALTYSPAILRSMWNHDSDLVAAMTAGDPAAAREVMYQELIQAHALMRDLAIGGDLTLDPGRP